MRSEQHHEHLPLLQDAGVIVGFIVTGLVGFAWYIVRELSASLLNSMRGVLITSVCGPAGPGGQTDDCPKDSRIWHHDGTSSPAI